MWKQWELEQGLTMMVSDDVVLSRFNRSKKHHQCSKHRNESKSSSRERLVKESFAAGSSKSNGDRYFVLVQSVNILIKIKVKLSSFLI